jgi:hypothetical protein
MSVIYSPLGWLLLVVTVLALSFTLRHKLLPKPIPNIPYNTNAVNKLLGDVPELVSYVLRNKRIFVSLFEQD